MLDVTAIFDRLDALQESFPELVKSERNKSAFWDAFAGGGGYRRTNGWSRNAASARLREML